jgi:hypothetical protein
MDGRMDNKEMDGWRKGRREEQHMEYITIDVVIS